MKSRKRPFVELSWQKEFHFSVTTSFICILEANIWENDIRKWSKEKRAETVCVKERAHSPSEKDLFWEDKQKKVIVCKFKGNLISPFESLSVHVAITFKSVVLRTTSLSDPSLMRLWPSYSLLVLFPNRCPCLSWKLPQIREEESGRKGREVRATGGLSRHWKHLVTFLRTVTGIHF